VKLVTFTAGADPRIGVLHDGGSVTDLSADPDLPLEMVGFVELGAAGLDAAARVVGAVDPLPHDAVRLLAPIRPRSNVMAIGRNYVEHAKEFTASGFDAPGAATIPDHPIIFTKANTSIIGPGDEIDIAFDGTGTCDYEGELGVVLGPGGLHIARDAAAHHVYGYTTINDMTVRELQRRHVQFFLGKSPATFCPMGPCIVTADEIDDIERCWVRTTVNGEERQAAPVADLIFDIPTLIETISSAVRFEAGDVIATGTPAGVGAGFDPPRFLAAGDVVEVSIDGLGTLRNPVV
jgi:2-keto-4-pentenoate hydratase/2-oxohepta-3-ene-1,7-dioic acid hydratase in catechol pathway